ncbi:MAG: hypothetical protein IH948_01940 [Bacteroidetes bacterium]|nr:hypothetical protein [Bacteroidota bacterium]
MERIFKFLILLMLVTACSKDKQDIINSEWVVVSSRENSESLFEYNTSGDECLSLSFENNKIDLSRKYTLFNGQCSGKVNFKSSNKVKFKTPFCLKSYCVCCLGMINNIHTNMTNFNKYELSNDQLSFKGENGEELNLIKK